MPFTLLSINYAFDTPGLVNPLDNGILLTAVPAGSYVECDHVLSTGFDQPGRLYASLSPDSTGNQTNVSNRVLESDTAPNTDSQPPLIAPYTVAASVATGLSSPARAITPCNLYLALLPDVLDPTSGSGTAVIKIYS